MTDTTGADDAHVQHAVQQELAWTPQVDDAGIGVAVEDGTVALSGEVDTYAERLAARRAALRVRGVCAVVDGLHVRGRPGSEATSVDLAREVDRALRTASEVPSSVNAVITDHDVTLMGEADWDYQRRAARRVVGQLAGVSKVDSLITLSMRPSAEDTEERIRAALRRSSLIDARSIHVALEGTSVILTGTVRSWPEKAEAGDAAWASPHVTDVDNRIVVRAL